MSLKTLTDEELVEEHERRSVIVDETNSVYREIEKQEREAWGIYVRACLAQEDVTKEIDRRNKKLRKKMKPFHSFTRTQNKEYWPLLSSECSCGVGWYAKFQSSWAKGAGVWDCQNMLDEAELEHLRDVRIEENQYTNEKGE